MEDINVYADRLPTAGITIGALKALDWVAPGQWDNVVGFENMLSAYTGESDPSLLQQVSDRALQLFDLLPEEGQRVPLRRGLLPGIGEALRGAREAAAALGDGAREAPPLVHVGHVRAQAARVREALVAAVAAATPADGVALLGISGLDNLRVDVSAERATHGSLRVADY